MSYDYKNERPHIFTEDGQKQFLAIRDEAKRLIGIAGAARLDKIIAKQSGSSWFHLACVDRLVELGELHELPTTGWAQNRVFVAAKVGE